MQVVYVVIEITATIGVGLLRPYENVETGRQLHILRKGLFSKQ